MKTDRIKCVILDDYQNVALDLADWASLENVSVEAIGAHVADQGELGRRLKGAAVVVAMRERTPFDADLLSRLPDLKLLVTTGMRNAAIDLEAASASGIVVCGTRGAGNPTVEIAWALILMTMRRLVPEMESFRSAGAWQSTLGRSLGGKTLGVVGLGRVGGDVARIALAFGMDVLAHSRSLTPEQARAGNVRFAPSLEDLLAEADIVSLHVPLSAQTHGLIDRRMLSLMKSEAILVNTGRGALVDEQALVEALRSGAIAGAGLDVYEREPLPADHPFRTLPNVVATPHLGYVTRENYASHYTDAVENIAAWAAGHPLRRLN